jgi:hypothetical protein
VTPDQGDMGLVGKSPQVATRQQGYIVGSELAGEVCMNLFEAWSRWLHGDPQP